MSEQETVEIPIILMTNVLFDTVTVTAEVETSSDLLDDYLEMINLARDQAEETAASVHEFLESEGISCEVGEATLEYTEYYMHVIVTINVEEPEEHNKVERLLEGHPEFSEFLEDEG